MLATTSDFNSDEFLFVGSDAKVALEAVATEALVSVRIVAFKACVVKLVAGAYHQSVVTPTGKVYVAYGTRTQKN